MLVPRFSAGDWVRIGLDRVAAERRIPSIDSLVREVGKTKGSFYSHFRNRGAFLLALVDEVERMTSDELAFRTPEVTERLIRIIVVFITTPIRPPDMAPGISRILASLAESESEVGLNLGSQLGQQLLAQASGD